MGYQGIMGYGVDFPLSRLGKAIILWVIRVYGLPEVWVKRVLTVVQKYCRERPILPSLPGIALATSAFENVLNTPGAEGRKHGWRVLTAQPNIAFEPSEPFTSQAKH